MRKNLRLEQTEASAGQGCVLWSASISNWATFSTTSKIPAMIIARAKVLPATPPARRSEGIRRQCASQRDSGDVDRDEDKIEREVELHGPFVGFAPSVQDLRCTRVAPGELEANGRRPHRRDELLHETTDGERQNDRKNKKPRAHSGRHKVGWIPHTGPRSYLRRIAM